MWQAIARNLRNIFVALVCVRVIRSFTSQLDRVGADFLSEVVLICQLAFVPLCFIVLRLAKLRRDQLTVDMIFIMLAHVVCYPWPCLDILVKVGTEWGCVVWLLVNFGAFISDLVDSYVGIFFG